MSPLEFKIAKYFCKFSDEELAVNWGFEKDAAARIRRKYNEARLHEQDHFDDLEWHPKLVVGNLEMTIGDCTVITRSEKIATVLNEYESSVPFTKM